MRLFIIGWLFVNIAPALSLADPYIDLIKVTSTIHPGEQREADSATFRIDLRVRVWGDGNVWIKRKLDPDALWLWRDGAYSPMPQPFVFTTDSTSERDTDLFFCFEGWGSRTFSTTALFTAKENGFYAMEWRKLLWTASPTGDWYYSMPDVALGQRTPAIPLRAATPEPASTSAFALGLIVFCFRRLR